MAPLPAASGVIQVKLSGTLSATAVWLTRFYIHYTGTAPTAAQLVTFNTALATAYSTHMESVVDTNTTLTLISSTDLSSATGATAVSSTGNVGTRAGTALPADVAMVVSYAIGRRYRGGHPRGYWRVGVTTDEASVRQWSTTLQGLVATAVGAFFADAIAAGWTGAGTLTHVNVSYYDGFTVVTNPITGRARNVPTLRAAPVVDTVTTLSARQSFGTQRRRLHYTEQ